MVFELVGVGSLQLSTALDVVTPLRELRLGVFPILLTPV
jgi:hypothetical protein